MMRIGMVPQFSARVGREDARVEFGGKARLIHSILSGQAGLSLTG
jgi:hypothetical protein